MNKKEYIVVKPSGPLRGTVDLCGAKNAVLVIMASLLLTKGRSCLHNVPDSSDVRGMIAVLESLGAVVTFDRESHVLVVDTALVHAYNVSAEMMQKMRASILVMGALLARFGKARVAAPGGCVIGARPIDYHLQSFKKMGIVIAEDGDHIHAHATDIQSSRIVLAYPSVGATENIMLAATKAKGTTTIVNAALEPEVLDLVFVLQKMGAHITIDAPATITIQGVQELHPVEHTVVVDRLEAGSLLLAAAITGGDITLPTARADMLDVFLEKLSEMGHTIIIGDNFTGIRLQATSTPRAVSFKTGPYPGFPTDLQAPMMAAQCLAQGMSIVEETVFNNRLLHVNALSKMGANIDADKKTAIVNGVKGLVGHTVEATDIRASCALVLAGLVAHGQTHVYGIHHWQRGYDALEKKLQLLGASIEIKSDDLIVASSTQTTEKRMHI